ncbi:MAG: Flp1 family type IVb pilin [Huintestinicola sp.]|uniref:Flp1 family type IVb pilin n=1 Tax=Huintestinicola sp. TaxID=2981661 RepID=UPI003F0F0701
MTKLVQKGSELALKAYVKADIAKDRAKQEISELAHNELGVSGIVVSLILIAIAVGLALAFKDKIAEFMGTIFGNAESQAGGLTSEPQI